MALKTVSDGDGIFGIEDAVAFYNSISGFLDTYARSEGKDVEKLIFVLFGLNHLRNWIAPGYDYRVSPIDDAQRFYHKIFDFPDFKLVAALCRRSKHAGGTRPLTSVGFAGSSMSTWRTLAELPSLAHEYPVAHFINDRYAEEVFLSVLKFYREEWFIPAQAPVHELPSWTELLDEGIDKVSDAKGLFGITETRDFLRSIKIALNEYEGRVVKDVELILFVLMGLNHLCEWIAPTSVWQLPNDERQDFYNAVQTHGDFILVNELCNRSKHLEASRETKAQYSDEVLNDEDHRLFDAGGLFDDGSPVAYLVEDKNVVVSCRNLMNYYDNWLNLHPNF